MLLGDATALTALFEDGAVVAAGFTRREARGAEEIASFAIGSGGRPYLANPRRVLQARETALVVADGSINVARRGEDGAWRYTIALLSPNPTITLENA